MCPSFKVVREEQHTTRGRARLLFEMLRGDSILDGWRDEGVKEALDLCLACKGCKGDCPTSTDVATYKAEFLAHYYEGERRPPHALALGRVATWLRLAEHAPALANLLARPGLPRALLGLSPERPVPPLATSTFQQRYARRPRARDNTGAPKVILWPDTFNNHFYPETAEAALEVLEHAGYEVVVPQGHLCCGRPLYDYGMLDLAKARLREVLAALRPYIRSNTPIVALEPSCAAVFRDELINLFADDPDARRLSRQSYSLAELLARTGSFRPPRLAGRALLHGHCHQKALWSTDPDATLLGRIGLEVERPDTGCCGLAGSFGYEANKYDLSMQIGELALFPAVRRAAPSAFIVADGFSCRSQIEHGTDRQALHTAEVLRLALREGAPAGVYPERAIARERARPSRAAAALATTALVVAGAVWWARSRRRAQ
jgi:Fe-S oxidoreductase